MARDAAGKNDMVKLREQIRNGTFAPCYLLYGTESYLIRQYRENLIRAVIPEGDSMNLTTFTGTSFDEHAVIDLANTMPFFNDYRLIVLEDSGIFSRSAGDLTEYLGRIPETTILLFTESPSVDAKNPEKKTTKSVDKRSKAYKAVVKYGFAAQLDTPSPADLSKWVAGQIRQENKKISAHTLQLFLSLCSSDMYRIRSELEKLLSYTLDKDRILDADVEAVCEKQPEDHIFQMIDAISMKDAKRAFSLYADLVSLRTPPGRILYLISGQYANLLHVRELQEKGMGNAAIGQETGLRGFVVEKCSRLSKRYTTAQLCACLTACAEAEEAFKTGQISDRMSLELLIAQLCL